LSFPSIGTHGRFAPDSLLEGDGFELSVPGKRVTGVDITR
jgi:hypothetical protein